MENVKYLILGSGPSGLTIANKLLDAGEKSFILLEKSNEPGGLCKSKFVDGSFLDTGGGHFLDFNNDIAKAFLFRFLPEDQWNIFTRISKIDIYQKLIDYPIEANIWQLDLEKQIEYLHSIAYANFSNSNIIPEKFVDWIKWKLGDKIASEYMLPYNSKIFHNYLHDLGTYWLYKLPNVSFVDTLKSCLTRNPQGKIPAHNKFYYPKKYGYGEVWTRMARRIVNHLKLNQPVISLDVQNKIVNGIYKANKIIVTIPWKSIKVYKGITIDNFDINNLINNSIDIDYFSFNKNTDAHWIYHPEPNLNYHRSLIRHNFVNNSKGFWTETNSLIYKKNTNSMFNFHNEFAYPLNTLNKEKIIKPFLEYLTSKDIFGLGRWGKWEHMNSDKVVEEAINFVDISLLKIN